MRLARGLLYASTMKKTASAAKKLLFSSERVRNLDGEAMRTVRGGLMVGCGASAVVCEYNTTANPPPPITTGFGCTIGGVTTIRCIDTAAR